MVLVEQARRYADERRAYEKVLQERLLTEMDPAERQTTEADAQILRLLGKTMNDPNVVQQPNYPGMTELIHELTKTLKALFEGGNAARGLSRFAAEWNVIIDNFGRGRELVAGFVASPPRGAAGQVRGRRGG